MFHSYVSHYQRVSPKQYPPTVRYTPHHGGSFYVCPFHRDDCGQQPLDKAGQLKLLSLLQHTRVYSIRIYLFVYIYICIYTLFMYLYQYILCHYVYTYIYIYTYVICLGRYIYSTYIYIYIYLYIIYMYYTHTCCITCFNVYESHHIHPSLFCLLDGQWDEKLGALRY